MRMNNGAKFIRFIKLIDWASSACHVVANYLLNHCSNWRHRISYSEYVYMPRIRDIEN